MIRETALLIFAIILFTVTVLATVNIGTQYKLSHGDVRSGVIGHLIQVNRDSNLVGVRIPSSNETLYEPLTTTWMENITYESGYSYYTRCVHYLEDVFAQEVQTINNTYLWNVPGPLHNNSKITVTFTLPNIFDCVKIYIIDDGFPEEIIMYASIYTEQIVYDKFTNDSGSYDYTGLNNQGLSVVLFEIRSDHIHATFNGGLSSDVPQTAPGDKPTQIYIVSISNHTFPTLHSIKYEM